MVLDLFSIRKPLQMPGLYWLTQILFMLRASATGSAIFGFLGLVYLDLLTYLSNDENSYKIDRSEVTENFQHFFFF